MRKRGYLRSDYAGRDVRWLEGDFRSWASQDHAEALQQGVKYCP